MGKGNRNLATLNSKMAAPIAKFAGRNFFLYFVRNEGVSRKLNLFTYSLVHAEQLKQAFQWETCTIPRYCVNCARYEHCILNPVAATKRFRFVCLLFDLLKSQW